MNNQIERIPFEFVISDDQLMGKLWKELSLPQQVALKAFYGLPLKGDAEKAIWAVFNDRCEYDYLGFVEKVEPTPYKPKEYSKLVGLLGRRSGKSTHITAFATLYEIIYGGHKAYVKDGQTLVIPYVATDIPTAQENMRAIESMAKSVPWLENELEPEYPKTEIRFKNGAVITAMSASVKMGRGWAIPVVIMDEVGFWYTKTDSANPDYEVERAVRPSQTQFEPFAKQFIISTPYVEDGILWDYWNGGTDGCKAALQDKGEYEDALVIWATTAAMGNPVITQDKHGKPTRIKLEKKYKEDPEAYVREYLARFVKAIGGLIPQHLLDQAIQKGIKERSKKEIEETGLVPYYVAAMDPATRHDSWAFTIGHMDNQGKVIQDVLRVWTPESKEALNPSDILDEITILCRQWGISMITTDQHQFEALEQLALQRGIALYRLVFSNQSKLGIYGSLLQLLRNQHIELLDVPIIRSQLSQLQKKYTALNQVQISAPPGKHDDVATVVALLAKMTLQLKPSIKVEKKPMTHLEKAIAAKQAREREMHFYSVD
jgi:hypothetical protein